MHGFRMGPHSPVVRHCRVGAPVKPGRQMPATVVAVAAMGWNVQLALRSITGKQPVGSVSKRNDAHVHEVSSNVDYRRHHRGDSTYSCIRRP